MAGLLSSSLKVVMLGACSVGKTATAIQFVRRHFVVEYDPTIEDSYRKQLEVDHETLVVEVLDTAGQEDFKSMREQWIRQGQAFFIVYSITDRNSLTEVHKIKKEIERIRDTSIDIFPVLLFGNKSDLSSLREVSAEEAMALSKPFSCGWMEGSAKENENIEEAYLKLLRAIKGKTKTLNAITSPRLPYNTEAVPPKRRFPCQLL